MLMAKRILIPVDFNVESLVTLKLALDESNERGMKVVLMYARYQDDSITDMLFYSPSRIIKQEMPAEFKEALSIIQNRYESILDSVSVALFHGQTTQAFKAFAEAHRVTDIVLPNLYRFNLTENSFNPLPLIRKSGLPYREVAWEPHVNTAQQHQLISLFTQPYAMQMNG